MISKVIHLCWLSGDPYPEKIRKCLDSWKRILPDYEVILWDTNRFDLNKSIWVEQAFKAKKYAFAADYIRFYALYHYGGIYMDSDVEVLKTFDDLLHLPYFVGAEKAGTIEAAIMGSEPHNPWIKQCLDYYDNREFVLEDGSLDIRKLPEIMVEEISKLQPIKTISLEESKSLSNLDFSKQVIVLPDEYFSPKVFDSRQVLLTPNTYAIHHYENSWFSHKAKFYYRMRSVLIRIFGYKTIRKAECTLMPWKFKH